MQKYIKELKWDNSEDRINAQNKCPWGRRKLENMAIGPSGFSLVVSIDTTREK